jgi:hypothetical protein
MDTSPKLAHTVDEHDPAREMVLLEQIERDPDVTRLHLQPIWVWQSVL